jgi:hypothetical protein
MSRIDAPKIMAQIQSRSGLGQGPCLAAPSSAFVDMSQSSTSKLLLPSLSVTQATPEPSPIANGHSTPVVKGKRKADEVDANTTPPDLKKDKATTFAVGPRRAFYCPSWFGLHSNHPTALRPSNATTATTAPSSFHRQKRARISTPTDASNTELPEPHETSATVGSWSVPSQSHFPHNNPN